MDKTLKTIRTDLLNSKLTLKRNNGRWYQYNWIDDAGNVLGQFDFKSSVPELYDAIKKGEIVAPISTGVVSESKSEPVALNHLASQKVVPMIKKTQTSEKYVSDLNAIAPSVSEMFSKEPPKNYGGFYFPDFTGSLFRRIKMGKNIFLAGESGTGKSELVQKLAEYYGQTVIRINFHEGITESNLIGKFIVKNAETSFAYGLVPLAMKKGYWLLLDEIDYAQPEHTSVLQAVLEGKPLVITSNEGEIVTPHESFRVFATGNTTGRGDTTDSYHGTNFMNSAFLDRWTIYQVEYSKKEPKILENLLHDADLSKKICKAFSLFRNLKKNGDITNAVFSTRRMINIAEALICGDTLSEAIQYELFNRYTSDESAMLSECLKDVFDKDHYFQKDWTLGMPHFVPLQVDQTSSSQTESVLNDSY